MRIEEDHKLDFTDVLIRPKRSTLSSRSEVNISRDFTFKWSGDTFSGVPVIAANMDGVGTFSMARAFEQDGNGLSVALVKHYPAEKLIRFFQEGGGRQSWYTIGLNDEDHEKFDYVNRELGDDAPQKICLDVANGYSQVFVDFLRDIRRQYPDKTIMAGNVVTGEMTEELILSGADIVKIGVGQGSVCTTRRVAGVGYPQLSAIIECADAAHGLDGLVCSDGGCTSPGDVAKALGAGADFVMMGGMFAGHDQSEAEVIEENGEKKVFFYGMASDTAMKKHKGDVAEYRASEGKTVKLPYRGDVNDTLQEILGGIRSACTYVGAKRLKELTKRTSFVRVTRQLNTVFGDD